MKRSDITDIWPEATKEQIDKIMNINGADVNSAKSEVTNLQTQLNAAQGELQKLKDGAAGQPDKLKETQDALAALQTELAGMKHAEAVRTVREKVSGEKKVPANLLTGETDPALGAEKLSAMGPELVMVTLGGDGVFCRFGDFAGTVKGFLVQVADTNGAGDTFLGAMLSRLALRGADPLAGLTGEELKACLTYANRAAALTCMRHGAIPAMPTKEEVENGF